MRTLATSALLLLGLAACAPPPPGPAPAPEQQVFFAELQRLCGRAFAGAVVEAPETDTLFTGRPLVAHVRECGADQVVIPVQVGDDRSRTWIVTRGAGGLRLTHIHRRPDGSEDENSRYGGVTRGPGTAWRQDFPADEFSIRMVPGRATQTWTLELWPGQVLDYSLHRVETDLRYRFRFDLSRPQP
jgi:hypothetical protein